MVIKSTCCPCKGPVFNPQHTHEGSPLPQAPGMQVVHRHMCSQSTHMKKIINLEENFKQKTQWQGGWIIEQPVYLILRNHVFHKGCISSWSSHQLCAMFLLFSHICQNLLLFINFIAIAPTCVGQSFLVALTGTSLMISNVKNYFINLLAICLCLPLRILILNTSNVSLLQL